MENHQNYILESNSQWPEEDSIIKRKSFNVKVEDVMLKQDPKNEDAPFC